MTSLDLSKLDFLQIIAVLVIAFFLHVISGAIETMNARRRLSDDIEMIERLSKLTLSDEEVRLLTSFRAQTIRELPVKQHGTSGLGINPVAIVASVWLFVGLLMVLSGVSWPVLVLAALGFAVSVAISKLSYSMGVSDGTLRERENLISAKRLENERPKDIGEWEHDEGDF